MDSSEFTSSFEDQIDPNFKPRSRSRSSTWPLKRPNIGCIRKNNSQEEETTMMMLETTYEEPSFTDSVIPEDIMSYGVNQEDRDDSLYPNFQSMDCSNEIFDPLYGLDQIADYTSMFMLPSEQTSASNETPKLSFTKLETIPQGSAFPSCSHDTKPVNPGQEPIDLNSAVEYKNTQTSSESQKPVSGCSSGSSSTTVSSKPKASSRKNAWGNLSYADLITQAIESSADKRLTLAQIYDWMVKNIPYFKDKGDSNSSAGWKNSIRHNLSLHNKFKRVQNEGTGKSSWWIINYDAKPTKARNPRARSSSTDAATTAKLRPYRERAVNKKNEAKKRKNQSKKDGANWVRSPTSAEGVGDYDRSSLNQAYNMAEYSSRPRTSSNASSLGGRMSPQRTILTQDLEAEGPPPLSPSSSSYTSGNNFDFSGRSESFTQNMDPHSKVVEGIENMDILNSTSPMTQSSTSDGASIYLNTTPPNRQQVPIATNSNRTPNLTTLLQQRRPGHGSVSKLNILIGDSQNQHFPNLDFGAAVSRERSNTMPKLQPQPKYRMCDNRKKSGDGSAQHVTGILFTTNSSAAQQGSASQKSFTQYQLCQVQNTQEMQQPPLQQPSRSAQISQPLRPVQPVSQLQEMYGQQQSENFFTPVQQQLNVNNQQIPNQSQNHPSSELSESKYLSDLNNIDNKDMFDPGSVDLEQIFQSMDPPDMIGIDFSSYFPQEDLDPSNMDSIVDFGKVEVANQPAQYQYPSNPAHVTSNQTGNLQQPQVYTRDDNIPNPPMMTLIATTPNNGFNCGATNGAVVMGDGGVCNRDVRFAQPQEILQDQNWSR